MKLNRRDFIRSAVAALMIPQATLELMGMERKLRHIIFQGETFSIRRPWRITKPTIFYNCHFNIYPEAEVGIIIDSPHCAVINCVFLREDNTTGVLFENLDTAINTTWGSVHAENTEAPFQGGILNAYRNLAKIS